MSTVESPRDLGEPERPTVATWLTPPTNRWAFRRVREIGPSERVRATGRTPLDEPSDPSLIDTSVVDYLERSYSNALVILHGSELAAEWYAPGVNPDDNHAVFSITKSVVGIVAASLIQEGALDDDARVDAYIPETAGTGYGAVTVRQALDMTANINFVEDYDGPDVRRYREANGQLPSAEGTGLHRFLTELEASGDHGQSFAYISPTASTVGWVCERATGRTLGDLISEHVWRPAGAERDGDLLLGPGAVANAGGGLCATARDIARVGALLLGDSSDDRVTRTVADILRPGDPDAWINGTMPDFLPGGAYRSLWYQLGGDPSRYLAAGIHGQRVYVDIPRRIVIAQLASLPSAFDQGTWDETIPLFERIARDATTGLHSH